MSLVFNIKMGNAGCIVVLMNMDIQRKQHLFEVDIGFTGRQYIG